MRHGDKVKNLNRTASHRRAMLANMACSLIMEKRITTTLAKAKALRSYVEPLITRAKESNNTTTLQSMHNRRIVFAYLQNKEAIKELFSEVSEKVGNRNGGYTRIIKLGTRLGDGAETAIIELVDFNETYKKEAKTEKKSRRRRRGGKKSQQETTTLANNTENQPTTEVAATTEEKPTQE
ncbi:MAG: 50S ribosomal protein L17 [Raineya sp.]|nr:50S ribosomal protein L17 [Raineya sp.]